MFRTIHPLEASRPSDLDLSDRHQPGTQPTALVAPASSLATVSLDDHIRDHGDPPERSNDGSPDRALGRKELADRIRIALDDLPSISERRWYFGKSTV